MIEDNPTNLQLMAYLLTAFGHETLEAHEGAEGVERARREKPDLILLDIHMPRMDGYEVARHLREKPEGMRIPIIAVTALAMVGDREKIMASGFSGYIAKPIDPETFSTQVNGYLAAALQAHPRQRVRWEQPPIAAKREWQKKIATILIVDNLGTNIDLARCILEPSGYGVVSAISVDEGLELARRTKPDLIVSDVHMLPQGGYEFLRLIRADPLLSKLPFIFLSSSVLSESERESALLLGATKFISRPISPTALLEQVKECLPKRDAALAMASDQDDPSAPGKWRTN